MTQNPKGPVTNQNEFDSDDIDFDENDYINNNRR
jgi:hypothetical protein